MKQVLRNKNIEIYRNLAEKVEYVKLKLYVVHKFMLQSPGNRILNK